MASTGGRCTVVTKGPLTGAIACSNSGGCCGAELKMAVRETEEHLKKSHQDPQLRVSSIGGAGENQVLFAAVVNDLRRAAAARVKAP